MKNWLIRADGSRKLLSQGMLYFEDLFLAMHGEPEVVSLKGGHELWVNTEASSYDMINEEATKLFLTSYPSQYEPIRGNVILRERKTSKRKKYGNK